MELIITIFAIPILGSWSFFKLMRKKGYSRSSVGWMTACVFSLLLFLSVYGAW